ncbi:uncharacterized protein LOC107813656 isoform X2 [Nicotiana tabacum]|uniref:Uncharacterized protein LOC107813656 isoform X2 n=3 Tax=Nicotiana TaxID=4085 RepID=A0A1S4BZU6_TOBAC|nr:PREDICTED: uncharacterized protein LOC104232422 isoform X2 [Nicotiana sylvestris]XP_016494425.1 PREDICTED: uncharacterized protein LOC107813656 isoform X2 [Nicotiana tabacum]
MSSVTHESAEMNNGMKNQENHKQQLSRDVTLGSELWTDGLLCAFEFVRGQRKTNESRSTFKNHSARHYAAREPKKPPLSKSRASYSSPQDVDKDQFIEPYYTESGYVDIENPHVQGYQQDYPYNPRERSSGNYWIPIGWARISELLQTVHVDTDWASQPVELTDEEDDVTVADVAAPYWERPVGPTWWCHVAAGHPFVNAWLNNAQWLHPAISIALRDESKLISERMKHLLYEVPVRVAGGLLFELLGQSVGDPFIEEDDIPVVLRSWQAHNFLLTALHVKGSASNINVLGIAEVQELLAAGSCNVPRTIHEVVALLTCRLARWDDRLFRKYIFGAADEAELKFMNRRTYEDMHLFSIILNQEIRRLSTQVIRVKWSLHAREEIVVELLQHLRGNAVRSLLQGILKSTRQMIEEQEAVRGRLFTIQDVMQSTVRAWLQDQSLRVQHNLGVFGGCGLVLSIITGLFGINVDGIPGNGGSPYAFAFFSLALVLLGAVLIAIGLIYLGLKKPVMEEQVEVRRLELQELVKMFQHEAESHAQVRKDASEAKMPAGATGLLSDGDKYVLIS